MEACRAVRQARKRCSATEGQDLRLRYVLRRRESGRGGPRLCWGEHADTSQRSIEEFLYGKLKLDNIEILTGIFPEETGGKVENLKFRFCHIDVDVYQSAKDVTEWIWERLVLGGMPLRRLWLGHASGHRRYVDGELPLKDRIALHNLNGHAIAIKRWRCTISPSERMRGGRMAIARERSPGRR